VLKRWRKYTDNHPRIRSKPVKLLRCAEEEMQVTLAELIKIFRFHLLQRNRFITVAAQTIPVKLSALPIQNLHCALTSIRIFDLIRKCVWQLWDELECFTPRIFSKHLSLLRLLTHLRDLIGLPVTVIVFPKGLQSFVATTSAACPRPNRARRDCAAVRDDAVWMAGSHQTLSRKHTSAASLGTPAERGCVAETSRSSFT
jgi:hypothetical protein